MNRTQRYFKDSAALFITRLVNVAGNFILVVWVSRAMGVETFGSYSAALGLLALFQIGAALGFENLIPREVGRDPASSGRMFTHSVLVASVAAIGLTGAMDGAALLFNYTRLTVLATWLISTALLPTGLISVAEAFFVAHQRVEYVSAITILEVAGRLAGTAAVLNGAGDILAVLSVYAAFRWLACLLLCGAYLRVIGRPDWPIQLSFLKPFIRQLYTFSLITILSALFWNVDIVTLSIFQNEYQLGIYNAAYKLVIIWSIVPASYMSVVLPILSRLYVDRSSRFSEVAVNSLRYLLAAALPLATGIMILGDQIILSVYGADFADSVVVLYLLGWLLVPLFLNNVLYRVLISSDRQAWTLRVTILGLALNIALSVLLVPRYGASGAALASLLSLSANLLVNTALVWRALGGIKPVPSLWRFLAAGALAASASWWLRPQLPWLWNAVLFVVVYATSVVALRAIGPGDWILVRRIFQRPSHVAQVKR